MTQFINAVLLIFFPMHAFAEGEKKADNYFTEADKILQIEKLLGSIPKSAGTSPDHLDSLMIIIEKQMQPSTGGSGPGNTAGTPPLGGMSQPGASIPAPGTTSINLIVAKEIKEELKAIIQLLTADSAQLEQISDFPKRFRHLDEIISNLAKGENSRVAQAGIFDLAGGNFAFNESAIIYGITDFALKRAKEELMEAHIKYLVAKLDSDKFIPQLLPQTLKLLHQFLEDDSWNYSKYGDLWKAAFQEDFRQMPMLLQNETFFDTVIATIGNRFKSDTIKYNKYIRIMYEVKPVVMGCAEIGTGVYRKQHPITLINSMAERYIADTSTTTPDNPKDTKKKITPIFNRTITGTSILLVVAGTFKDNVYTPVSPELIRTLPDKGWPLLFKLIYLRNKAGLRKTLGARNAGDFLNISVSQSQTIVELRSLILELVANAQNCQELLTNYKRPGELSQAVKELSFEEVRKLIDLSFQITEQGFTTIEKFAPNSTLPHALAKYRTEVKPYIENVSQIAEGLSTKQYGKVLNGTLDVFDNINTKLLADSLESPELQHTMKYLTKYGSFMVNILSAQNSEDVETSLQELIPKGQYKLKDASKFSVSLSLYPGGMGGVEWLKKYDTDSEGNKIDSTGKWHSKGSLAFYLPIGIDLNFGLKKATSSFNIFVQAFDLGAVMNYRLNSEAEVETNPEIGFKQLLSPGVAFMFHLPKSPVVIGTAFNYTPELRKVNSEKASYSANAMRLGAFMSVDITAIHISVFKSNAMAKW